MPLIQKPNYNQIFASQAPEQDKPAVFNNYPGGWGVESRPNNGKPTIKGFNYLQQTSDLKDLWILQNGACLPYDESIEYADGAPVLKDGVIQYKTAGGFKSRDAVTVPTYSNAADGVDPMMGVAEGAYFNVRSTNDESYIDEYQNAGGSAVATGKSYLSALGVQLQEKAASTVKDAGGKNQQEINDEQAVLNANQSNKNSLTVDILDFIPKSEWVNIAQKTSNYDCYDALVSAVSASDGNVVISKAGKYIFKTAYAGTSDLNISMSENVELDFTQVAAGTIPLSNTGSLTKLTNAFSDISKFSRSLVFTSTVGLSAGDWICFYNPTEYSYSLWRPYYREGEWKKISKIDGNTVYFESAFYSDYISANMELYKLNSVTSKIKGGKITCKNSTSTAVVKFSLSSDASDTDVEFDTVSYSSLEYDRCVSPRTFNPNCYNFGAGMDDYGYLNSNSFDYKVFGGSLYSRRHAIALGGGTGLCSVPVYNFRCYDSVLTNDPTVDVGAADMHGNIAHSSYERCQIYGATGIGGGDECYYKNCEIYGDVDGVTGYCAEIKGGSFGWIDCNHHVNKNPQIPRSRGIIDIGGAGSPITSKTVKDCNIQVSGKVFSDAATNNVTTFVKIINRGSSVNINPTVSDVEFLTSQDIGNVLLISSISGTDNSKGIIVEGISGKMPVDSICRLGSGYLNAPMRMQKQSGKAAISSIAGTQIITGNINLPFSYPKLPEVQQYIRGVNGAAMPYFGGQAVVSLGVYSQNNASYRSTISTPTAMSAGDSAELVYCVGLNEC